MLKIRCLIIVLILLLVTMGLPHAVSADSVDYAIPNGHFYTQAVAADTPAGYGYAITDEGVDDRGQPIKLWSEFQRLGGVGRLGYPASHRFVWRGFVCQVTQRVVLQWRPDLKSVAFLNIMDIASEAGKDNYLLTARQIPAPANFQALETGLSFNAIVAKRYALLDAYPAIKAKYFSATDPLNQNGLPTAPVTDMGDAYVLRAQRVVIQQWKKNTPWAKAGEVTVALGGDLAKEIGLVSAQDAQASTPRPASANNPPLAQPPAHPQQPVPVVFAGADDVDWSKVPAGVAQYRTNIVAAVNQWGKGKVTASQIVAQAVQENPRGDPKATSRSGAYGLMQFMPGTWTATTKKMHGQALPLTAAGDPNYAYAAGVFLMQEYVTKYGSWDKALIAYNAGPLFANVAFNSLPAETQRYLTSIKANAARYHK